jgi:superfamily II DNA or RNA helicase
LKAVISNRIFLDYTPEIAERVKEELTFTLPPPIPGGRPKVMKMYNTIGKVFSLPAGCASMIPETFITKDLRVEVPVEFPDFSFELRPDQMEIYDQVESSCLINANPSWGKTFTAIAIAAKLGQKTLVICHNTILRDQWEKEIRKTLGIDCGVIGSGKLNYNSPITVSNIQTLRNHSRTLASEFGTVIVDEVHRAPAKVFSNTLNEMKAKYKIGLSATLERKDGMHFALPLYFSSQLYVASRANQMKPEIHIYELPIKFPGNAMTPWAVRLNEFYEDPSYYKFVSEITQAYVAKGHKGLVVADRVAFLDKLEEDYDNVVAITGKISNSEERELRLQSVITDKDVIAGTTSIFKEGVSQNVLSLLVIAVPLNNIPVLEQLIGRVQRKMEGKMQPIVVDIYCQGKTSKNQAYNRAAHYKEQGYKTVLTKLERV